AESAERARNAPTPPRPLPRHEDYKGAEEKAAQGGEEEGQQVGGGGSVEGYELKSCRKLIDDLEEQLVQSVPVKEVGRILGEARSATSLLQAQAVQMEVEAVRQAVQMEVEAVRRKTAMDHAIDHAAQVEEDSRQVGRYSETREEEAWRLRAAKSSHLAPQVERPGERLGGRSPEARFAELQGRVEVLEVDKAALLKELEVAHKGRVEALEVDKAALLKELEVAHKVLEVDTAALLKELEVAHKVSGMREAIGRLSDKEWLQEGGLQGIVRPGEALSVGLAALESALARGAREIGALGLRASSSAPTGDPWRRRARLGGRAKDKGPPRPGAESVEEF
ncbi:hypothetical protein T484DRAFT_1851447, partial [Baffinella frigidus]